VIVFWIRQHDWLQSVLPPKTARARSEAFRDSPKPCSYQRAKHVTTSRDAVFLYASPQLLDAAFHYAPSDDYTSDAPPRRRVPLRAAAHSRLTLVNTCQLRAALLNAPPFNLASDAPQRRRVPLRAVATSRLTLVNTFVAVQ